VLGGLFRRAGIDFSRYAQELHAAAALAPADLERLQTARLRQLLASAEASPFHRERLLRAGLSAAGLRGVADLKRLPPLTKDDLREHGPGPFLTRRITRPFRSRTAGSSGTPVTVLRDVRGRAHLLARRWACQSWHGLRPGDREARFWGRSPAFWRDSLLQAAANRRVFTFLAAEPAAQEREAVALRRFRPDFVYGYSSLVLRAAERFDAFGSPPRLKAVVCTAESISPSQRRFISEVFGCPVLVEYGCSEVDIIGYTCPEQRLHVLAPELILEIDCDREQAEEGEVLVTDLRNDLMPLLRYRLGDHIRFSRESCTCGWRTPVIAELQGRDTDRILVLPSGRHVHAVVFAHAFEALCDEGLPIRRFQVVQNGPDRLQIHVEGSGPSLSAPETSHRIEQCVLRRLPEPLHIDLIFGPVPTTPGVKLAYFVPLTKGGGPAARSGGGES
jgi:phenylacetate-CoA ligase